MGARGKPVCLWSHRVDLKFANIYCARGTASEVLNEYIESVGGREALAKVPKPKKRGRASTTNGTPASQQKKFKKEASEDVKSETPDKPKLPPGNWEDLVASIDTMDHQVGGLFVLLTFKDGTRVKQPVCKYTSYVHLNPYE